MKARVEGEVAKHELRSSRFYLPGVVVVTKCPRCNREHRKDMGASYMVRPKVNCMERIYNHCSECDMEWSTKVVVRLSLEIYEGES